jgi:prepilin-type N-terminal cleavage/methylation domain-containing protein
VLASRDGFTLIEVLVAMVILAVGLLGLEALGIHAVRATAQADRTTRAAAVGMQHLEGAIQELRRTPPKAPGTLDVTANGYRVQRGVCYSRDAIVASHVTALVYVVVTPPSRGAASPRPDTLRSFVFLPISPSGITTSNACP